MKLSSNFENTNLTNHLFSSIDQIKGIGPKAFEIFKNRFGVRTIDVLFNLPTKYINRFKNTSIKNCLDGEILTTDIIIVELNIKKPFYKKKFPSKIVTFGIDDEKDQRLDVIYFNLYSPSISKSYVLNKKYTISGKFEIYRGIPQITHPHYLIPI